MKLTQTEFPYFMGTMKICLYARWKLFKYLINPECGKERAWGAGQADALILSALFLG